MRKKWLYTRAFRPHNKKQCAQGSSYLQHLMERNLGIIHLRFPFHWEFIFALFVAPCFDFTSNPPPLLECSLCRTELLLEEGYRIVNSEVKLLLFSLMLQSDVLGPSAAILWPILRIASLLFCCPNLLRISSLFVSSDSKYLIFYSVLKTVKHFLQKL